MQLIPMELVKWKKVKYLRQGQTFDYDYEFTLPEPLASWDVFDYWERARVESMRKNLSKGMVLYDIGTEQGWCNLAYADMVGAENMVLVEPTTVFWPNIRATWEMNFDVPPLASVEALIGSKSEGKFALATKGFPKSAHGSLVDRNAYTYIHDNANNTPTTTIDGLTALIGAPDAITIDIEGAEMLALAGAEKTLTEYSPLVWVSIHPDMMLRDYDYHKEDLLAHMKLLGYTYQLLDTDHEEHYFFWPHGRNVTL